MKHAAAFLSERHDWETPQGLFDALNREFRFELDAAALPETAKCEAFYTPDDDALTQAWTGSVFLNPPYGAGIGNWITYAYLQAQRWGGPVVCLIPARTETSWWHRYVMHAEEVRLIKGRVQFSGIGSAPFPSCVVVFRRGDYQARFTAMDRMNSDAPLFAEVS